MGQDPGDKEIDVETEIRPRAEGEEPTTNKYKIPEYGMS